MRKLVAFTSLLLTLLFSCQREQEPFEQLASPSFHAAEETSTILTMHQATVKSHLHLVAKGLTALMDHGPFQETLYAYAIKQEVEGDFQVLLKDLEFFHEEASILPLIQAHLTHCGIPVNEVQAIGNILTDFTLEGQKFETGIFIPHLDTAEPSFVPLVWNGLKPSFVSPFNYFGETDFSCYRTATENMIELLTQDTAQVLANPTWFVKLFVKVDDKYKEVMSGERKFLERCYCRTAIPDSQCIPGSDMGNFVTIGNCGRYLPIFGIDCTGKCEREIE